MDVITLVVVFAMLWSISMVLYSCLSHLKKISEAIEKQHESDQQFRRDLMSKLDRVNVNFAKIGNSGNLPS